MTYSEMVDKINSFSSLEEQQGVKKVKKFSILGALRLANSLKLFGYTPYSASVNNQGYVSLEFIKDGKHHRYDIRTGKKMEHYIMED